MIAELDTAAAQATTAPIIRMNLGDLHASPTNPRKHFDLARIEELANSIEEHGVKMPLWVRPSKAEKGKFEIIAGERRYRASVRLAEQLAMRQVEAEGDEASRLSALFQARTDVPVIVEDLDDGTVLELQLVENLQRSDLSALEEARGYQSLLDLKEKTYTPALIAQRLGKSIDTVLNKVNMLRAPQVLQEALEKGTVSERHLQMVAKIPGEKGRKECAERILSGEYDYQEGGKRALSVRETLGLINGDYRQSLKGVPWVLEDAALLPDVGACATCPHFARHAATQDAELAKELGNERGQTDPLTCMNPACFKQKQQAVWKQREAQSKEGTVTVLKPKEAEKIINDYGTLPHNSPWVKLDDTLGYEILGHYDEKKSPVWRTVVEDRLPAGAVHVVNTAKSGIIELVKRTVAVEAGKLHKKHGKLFEKVKPSGKKELTDSEKKKKEKEAFENKVSLKTKNCLLQYLYDAALSKGMDAEGLLAMLDSALYEAGMDGNRQICLWLKLEPEEVKKGRSLDQSHYRKAILKSLRDRDAGKPEIEAMLMIANVAKWVKAYGLKISSLAPLQQYFGFDEKTILAIATKEVQTELDAKKKPEKPVKVAAKNSTDPTDVSTAKEVSKTKAADKRAKKGLTPDQRTKIADAQKKRWGKQAAAKSRVKGTSDNKKDYSKAAAKKAGKVDHDAEAEAGMLDAQVTRIRAGEGYPAVLGPRPAKGTFPALEWDVKKNKLSEAVKAAELAAKSRTAKKAAAKKTAAAPAADADADDAYVNDAE